MLWIVLFVMFLAIGAAGFFCFRSVEKRIIDAGPQPNRYGDLVQGQPEKPRFWKRVCLWSTVGVLVILTVFSSITKVDAGHQAVVYQFGSIQGQLAEGVHAIWPWQDTKDSNIQTQKEQFDKLAAFTKETQDVFVTLTLNYSISPDAIQSLYRTVGPGYFNTLVPNRLNQIVKDITVKYAATDIAPNREKIRNDIRDRLRNELKPYSVDVVDVNIDNIAFSNKFTDAIEQKQIATQDALKAEAVVKQKKAEADQAVAVADGKARSTVAEAQGQAKANRLLSNSLTDQLIRFQALQRFNDKVQIVMVPSGQGNLLDPSTFLKQP